MLLQIMNWNSEHDVLLLEQVIAAQPYRFRQSTKYRGLAWEKVVNELNSKPVFSGKLKYKRAVRDRYNLLAKKYKDQREEEKKSGKLKETTHASQLLGFLTGKFDESDTGIVEKYTHGELEHEIANALKRKLLDESLKVVDKNEREENSSKVEQCSTTIIASENASDALERETSDAMRRKLVEETTELVGINGRESSSGKFGQHNGSTEENVSNQEIQSNLQNVLQRKLIPDKPEGIANVLDERLDNSTEDIKINEEKYDEVPSKRHKPEDTTSEQQLLDLQLCLRKEELELKRKQLEMQTNVYSEIQKQQLILIQQQTQMFQQIHQQQLQSQQQLQQQQQQMIMQTKLMMTLVDRFCQHTSKS